MTKSLSCSDDSDAFQQKICEKLTKTQDELEISTGTIEPSRMDNTSDSDTENLVLSNNQKNSDSENQDSLEQKLCYADTESNDQQKVRYIRAAFVCYD